MNETQVLCDEKLLTKMKFIFQNVDFFRLPITIIICFSGFVSLLATIGNGLVIVTILRKPVLQKPSYLLIASMAFLDLLVGSLFYPFLMVRMAWRLQNNEFDMCRTSMITNVAGLFLISMSLTMSLFLSIDRYLALTLKHRYRLKVTRRKVIRTILATW